MISFERLRQILIERDISSRQLERDLGISSNATTALNNDRSVRLDVIVKLCVYLDVPIEAIVEIKR